MLSLFVLGLKNLLLKQTERNQLPPANEVWGKVYRRVSVHRGGGGGAVPDQVHPSGTRYTSPPRSRYPPRSRHPPGADTPPGADLSQEQTYPGSKPPLPQDQTPPGADTPPGSRHLPRADTPWEQTLPTPTPQADTPQSRHLPRSKHPREQTPPGTEHAGRYGQRAGGTHPTGMQSCY